MKSLLRKLEQYFISNTSWIYLVLLLFISYLLVQSVVSSSMENYLSIFLRLSLWHLPILLFAHFREWLTSKCHLALLSVLWLFCFIAYPLLLFQNRIYVINQLINKEQYNGPHVDILGEFSFSFLLTVGGAILATELALLISLYLVNRKQKKRWTEKLNIEHLILGVVLTISILLALKGTIEYGPVESSNAVLGLLGRIGFFVLFLFQYLLINLVYYLYYLINKQILIPRFFKKKGVIYYGFSVAGVVLIFYPVFVALIRLLPIVDDLGLANYFSDTSVFASDGGAGPFIIMLLSVPIIISNQWFQQSSRIANLEKEQSETELSLLKQQINPHFFFNTLNNLYALSITKDQRTPEVILQLSELMRYVIYKGKEEWVSLEEEIKYIEDYVKLQQIRIHKDFEFVFEKTVDDASKPIPPLLFITFVENAFKHGIEKAGSACFMHLHLISNDEGLYFSCINSLEDEERPTEPSGIGLENLKRRLMLRFPNRHEIFTNEKQNSFTASFKIADL